MTIYIIYAIIILVTIILYFLVKDKIEFIKKLGITTIISGVVILILGLISNIVLNTFLNTFNITKISSLILKKFIYNSILLLIVGFFVIFISKILAKKKIKAPSSGTQ